MDIQVEYIYKDYTLEKLEVLGRAIGQAVHGGEVIELVGDVGAGKTTLTKAIAAGMGIETPVHSPTFTIQNQYKTSGDLTLVHYDFYRLSEPGIMRDELTEALSEKQHVVVIEWAGIVEGVLPSDRLTIRLAPHTETTRNIELAAGGASSQKILEQL